MAVGDFAALLWASLGIMFVGLLIYGFRPMARWRYRHIPGPRPSWLLGNLVEMLREGQEAFCARCSREYPGVWLFWLGGIPVVMTDDPLLARKVMHRPRRHKIYNLQVGEQEKFDSHNLVFVNGEEWKVSRNAWQPFFSRDSVSRHGKLMSRSADRLCSYLREVAAKGQAIDIWRDAILKMTLDVVGTCAFGVNFNTLGEVTQHESEQQLRNTPTDRLVRSLTTFFELFGFENWYFAFFFLFPELEHSIKWLANHFPNAAFKRELWARTQLKQVGTELVQQAAKGFEQREERPSAVDPGSFLALILRTVHREAGARGVDDTWATSQASTFILAGFETTANAIAFAVYLVSCHPDAESRLLAELDAFGGGRVPTLEDLDAGELPYAQACIKEALRLYPPGSTAVREANDGMVLGSYKLPDLTAVQVSIYAMHRNPKYWSRPEAFIPDRFMEGTPESQEVVAGAYVPFGDGSRKCIGYRFALLEATLTLVKLYQQFTFRLLPGQVPLKVRTTITLGPAEGIHLTVHPRN